MAANRPEHPDDNLMERFDRARQRRFSARDAILAVGVAALILILCAGASIRKQGEEMNAGPGRDIVLAVGDPAGWVADHLPFHSAVSELTAGLSPNADLSSVPGGFSPALAAGTAGGIPPVTVDSFDPAQIGLPEPARRTLHTLLVTGDSMSEPLDLDLARGLASSGVRVIRDPHLGTAISSTVLVNWGKLAAYQVRQDHPNAVVMFIGANDGYPMPGPGGKTVNCCSAEWAAIYANRIRLMMNTYRQAGVGRVYWLTLPTPRDPVRQRIALMVNAAIAVAAEPWRDQVRVIDTVPVFTPGDRYRDSMPINGQPTIVRQSDGIHLNDAGSQLAEQIVLAAIRRDFVF